MSSSPSWVWTSAIGWIVMEFDKWSFIMPNVRVYYYVPAKLMTFPSASAALCVWCYSANVSILTRLTKRMNMVDIISTCYYRDDVTMLTLAFSSEHLWAKVQPRWLLAFYFVTCYLVAGSICLHQSRHVNPICPQAEPGTSTTCAANFKTVVSRSDSMTCWAHIPEHARI